MDLINSEKQLMSNMVELYYNCANQTQKYWKRDNQAALKIQSKFKMYMKRKEFLRKKEAAIKIQTQFRAYYARKQFKKKYIKDNNQKNLRYFDQQATLIQKVFRGFYLRKYKHDFYSRKEELNALLKKNQQFQKSLEEFGKAQAIQAEQYKRQLAVLQFKSLAKNLHHLSSTQNIPGVYNSPFAFQKPKVFQQTVQQHLKTQFKASYRWRPPRKEDILKYSIKTGK